MLVLRLYGAKEGRRSVSIVLHGTLAMEVSITSKEPVGKELRSLSHIAHFRREANAMPRQTRPNSESQRAKELSQGMGNPKRSPLRDVVRQLRRKAKVCLYTSRYLL